MDCSSPTGTSLDSGTREYEIFTRRQIKEHGQLLRATVQFLRSKQAHNVNPCSRLEQLKKYTAKKAVTLKVRGEVLTGCHPGIHSKGWTTEESRFVFRHSRFSQCLSWKVSSKWSPMSYYRTSPTFHSLRTFPNLLNSSLTSSPATSSLLGRLSLPISLKQISRFREQYPTAGAALTKCELLCSPERKRERERERERFLSLYSLWINTERCVSSAIVYWKLKISVFV